MKLSDIATTIHHHQQLPVEIVKTLRQNFKHPEPNVHDESKVRIRTDQHYKPDKGEHCWRNKYHRHVSQQSHGFYTPAHIPYETVGEVVLDLKDLVQGSVGYSAKNEAKAKTWRKIRPKPKDKLSKRRETIRFDSTPQQEPPKATPIETPTKKKEKGKADDKSPRTNGGLDEIRQNLQVHRKRVVSVRAGKPYFDCIREEAALKAAALLMQQNNKPERCISPTRLRHFVSKMRVERQDPKVCAPADRGLTHEASNDEDIIRASKERSMRNFTSKLNCLYNLLCSLYNLRTKDLRTKTPLPRDFIKILRASIPLDHRGRLIRTVRHTANPQSRAAYLQSSTDSRMVEIDNFPVGSPHMFSRPSCMYDSASSIFKATMGDNIPPGSGNIFLRKFARAKEGVPKIAEMTWDELVEGKSPAAQQDSTQRNAPGRSSFLHTVRTAFRTRRTGIIHHLPQNSPALQQTENLTMWQQVASNERNATKADAMSPANTRILAQQRRRRTSINTLADIVGENFGQIRKRTAQNVKDKLEQSRVRERKVFTEKIKKAITPAWVYETDLKAMRQAGVDVQRDFEDDNIKPAEWHKELTKEAESLSLSNNSEIKKLMDKFYPFSIDDVHSVAFVKAKLCLVIQSLPLYELCSIPMQEALQFLMAHILDGSPNALNDWMSQRKLAPLPPTEQKQNS